MGRAVAKYLQTLFDKEAGHGRKVLPMDSLLAGKTRKEASRMFFETLVWSLNTEFNSIFLIFDPVAVALICFKKYPILNLDSGTGFGLEKYFNRNDMPFFKKKIKKG